MEALYLKGKPQKAQESVNFLRRLPPDLIQGLEPATDQQQLCSILEGVGAKIMDLTKNFPNTSSLEAIHQEKLDDKGKVTDTRDQKSRYLCLVSGEAQELDFIEYRVDIEGNEVLPKGVPGGFMLTEGFTSAALNFHPQYRSESTFRYLGRQSINGRKTFVVGFAQIPGKAHLSGAFRQGETSTTTFFQGLAWIDTATYQITRLHTELLAPLPELQLEKEDTDINIQEVHFNHQKETLSLPTEITVTLDWNRKRFRNRREYSDFRVFSVETGQKIGKPKVAANPSREPPASSFTR